MPDPTIDSVDPARRTWRRTELIAGAWLTGNRSPRTRATYSTSIRSWFGWCQQDDVKPPDGVRSHIEVWQPELERTGYAPRTIAVRLTALTSFYRCCENGELIVRSPMIRVRRPRVERGSPRTALTRGLPARLRMRQ